MEIEEKVRQYIVDNFMYSGDASELSDDRQLFDSGIVDSTGVLELVSFVEESFGVKVDDTEMVPENFSTVANLAAFVRRKQ